MFEEGKGNITHRRHKDFVMKHQTSIDCWGAVRCGSGTDQEEKKRDRRNKEHGDGKQGGK